MWAITWIVLHVDLTSFLSGTSVVVQNQNSYDHKGAHTGSRNSTNINCWRAIWRKNKYEVSKNAAKKVREDDSIDNAEYVACK
jgi:HSP90 family molecular chaperone